MSPDLFFLQALMPASSAAQPQASAPSVASAAALSPTDDPAEIEKALVLLDARIVKGEAMITEQRARLGTDNLPYLRHLHTLRQARAQLRQTLDELRNREPVSFTEARQRRASAAFICLLEMTRRREYDAPRFAEQEALVCAYLREDPDWADALLSGQVPLPS
jgi:hypothetical protein